MKRKPVRRSKPARSKWTGRPRLKAYVRIQAGKPDAIEAFVEASAQALGILLDPAWRDGVAFNLRLILRHAKRVDEFALPDDTEPAPVFRA
jgi:hypothetical protein